MTTATGIATPRLDENIVLFTRLLRAIGMRLGPADAVDAIAAVREVGIADKGFFLGALSACFVRRPEDIHAFRQAFFLFWQNPRFHERIRDLLLPQIKNNFDTEDEDHDPLLQRLRDIMADSAAPPTTEEIERIDIDSTATASERERLEEKDFRMMGADELEAAERAIRELRPALPRRKSRRSVPAKNGNRIDLRLSLRQAARKRGGVILPETIAPRMQPRPLVVLLDISASMESYTRPMLHFMHSLTRNHHPVHSFVFGTRLTNITRELKHRDIDAALAETSAAVADWSGGTRICDNLGRFNRDWSRRVLSGAPQVLLITDGLEREHDEALGHEIDRLHKSCHRLIWLNPLLRYDAFEAKSISIRRMLPHVDAFLPVHSLDSMADVVNALAENGGEFRA